MSDGPEALVSGGLVALQHAVAFPGPPAPGRGRHGGWYGGRGNCGVGAKYHAGLAIWTTRLPGEAENRSNVAAERQAPDTRPVTARLSRAFSAT